jgi:hypothetical protein
MTVRGMGKSGKRIGMLRDIRSLQRSGNNCFDIIITSFITVCIPGSLYGSQLHSKRSKRYN